MRVPEQVDLDFLATNQTNPEWADYLLTHWQIVLSKFVYDDFSQACYGMTQILRSRAFSENVTDRKPYFLAMERLAATGLEMLNQNNEGNSPISAITSYKMDVANLESVRGAALIQLSRFSEAAHMYQQSLTHFSEFAELVISEGGDDGELLIDIREKIITCRIKTAETWYGYCRKLPEDLRRLQLSFLIMNLETAREEYADAEDYDRMDYVDTLMNSPNAMLSKMGGPDRRVLTEVESYGYDRSYESWCSRNHLFFNLGSQMNHPYPEWQNDDYIFETSDYGKLLMQDITEGFDHCRRSMYGFQAKDSRKYIERTYDTEMLVDTYARVITLFLKIAKVISITYGEAENMDFATVSRNMKGNENRYLDAIYSVYTSVFPIFNGVGPDPSEPEFKVIQAAYYQSFMRDSIISGAVEVLHGGSPQSLEDFYCSVTTEYLEHVVMDIMRSFNEVVFLLQLAFLE